MTDRDLGALLERAAEDVLERDLAEKAWNAALATRRTRRRTVVAGVGAVAAAGLAVTAVQLGGSDQPRPRPAESSTTSTGGGVLPDGTAYAVMPPEGKEAQLRDFDAGLPSTIDVNAPTEPFSPARPPASVVAVYLRTVGERFHPVLVTGDGHQLELADVDLVRTTDASGNQATPLGPRAVGGGGRYVVFPQRDHVLRLDTRTGATVSYPIPSEHVEWAGWNATGSLVVARDAKSTWTIDPSDPGAASLSVGRGAGYEGTFRVTTTDTVPAVRVTRFDGSGRPLESTPVPSPVTGLAGETVSSGQLAATGAFFDQDVTSTVIRRGSGPIYQGLLVVEPSSAAAKVLLAPENPDGQTGRFKGCCTVLGWADGRTVLFQSVGSHGRWILAWRTTTGEVFDVSRITTGAPDDPPTPVALNVGRRD